MAAVPVARGASKDIGIAMVNVQFVPATIHVDPGDITTLRVFNNDTGIPHTFDLDDFNVHLGTLSAPMQPGTNQTATFTADREGTFWFHCSIPGHSSKQGAGYTGMAGTIVVGRGTPPPDLTPLLIGGGVAAVVVVLLAVLLIRRRGRSS